MATRPVMEIDKGFFSTRDEAMQDIIETGYWPTTYVSERMDALPVHWHDHNSMGYVIEGSTYLLDEVGERVTLEAGDRLRVPAGALHAEGEVTERITYIVALEKPENFFDAFRMLDPVAWPSPEPLDHSPGN